MTDISIEDFAAQLRTYLLPQFSDKNGEVDDLDFSALKVGRQFVYISARGKNMDYVNEMEKEIVQTIYHCVEGNNRGGSSGSFVERSSGSFVAAICTYFSKTKPMSSMYHIRNMYFSSRIISPIVYQHLINYYINQKLRAVVRDKEITDFSAKPWAKVKYRSL